MRLIVAYWSDGQTTTNRQSTGGESAASRCPHRRYRTTAGCPSGAASSGRRPRWGGRRKALLSIEQETQFLAPWAEQAKQAGVLVLSPIRAALAQRLGRPVAASVVWRLLARHGWRKVAPDTRHPKSDLAAQEAWKKNCPKHWRPS
ncbi:MAG: winged helix-turn-helix domain-containing protein [Betaproteobacteria bacterium]|nr:winged helix-turn-helix domain-containing protein [Betaproteobacteria bacterium]